MLRDSTHAIVFEAIPAGVTIEAVYGLGEGIVSGELSPDLYIVEKESLRIISKATAPQDRMIARRIFSPREYAKGADLNRGMVPNEEVTVKLHLDLGDLKAAGYRVFLFYS